MAAPAPDRRTLALLTTYYKPVLGGVETMAERLATYLARRGYPVVVCTKRTSREHPAAERLDGVDVVRVSPTGPRRALGKWLASPSIVMAVWRRRRDVRLICCVDYRGLGIAGILAASLIGVPVVFDSETDGTLSGEAVRRRLERLGVSRTSPVASAATWPIRVAYGHADWYVCPSHAIEQETAASGVPASRMSYVPHGVDTRRFKPVCDCEKLALRTRLGLPEHAVIGAYVGRLSVEKGVIEAVEAWARAGVGDAVLMLVGPDMPGHPWDAAPRARERAAALGIASKVRFVGGVPQAEVATWLQAADFAVQPSYFEAFGIAAAEAMATGLPVIATDVGGYRDYVEPEVTGDRVPPKDVDALASAIHTMVTDGDRRRRLGANARQAAARFDEDVVFTQFAALFDRLAPPPA